VKVGDLVRIEHDESFKVGVVVNIDDRTMPEKVFIFVAEEGVVEGWDDECEVVSPVG